MLKTITAFAATLLAIVFVAESFVPNSAPTYGGTYVENYGSISYRADGCGVMGMEVESPNNYGVLLHEMSQDDMPRVAGAKVKDIPVNESKSVAKGPEHKIPQPNKPVINHSSNHRIIYHNGCCGYRYYHTGPCGRTWRHVNYQRCQPIRNVGRFFHNVRPVRRSIGWVFCGRRCW